MKIQKAFIKESKMDAEIRDVLDRIKDMDPYSEDYTKAVDNLEKLYKARSYDTHRHLSPDTLAIIAGNLLGIVIILGYEKANVITSKAVGFILKGRV
jgi:hypothetical protein